MMSTAYVAPCLPPLVAWTFLFPNLSFSACCNSCLPTALLARTVSRMSFSEWTMMPCALRSWPSSNLSVTGLLCHPAGVPPLRHLCTNLAQRSLLSCALKVFERLLLKRLHPRLNPLIDESQAGFQWGAEEQIYTLAETLRLRAGTRTFCAFVDVRKAFDVAWRDAVLVKLAAAGIAGSTWRVLDDLLSPTSARVLSMGICPSHGLRVWVSAKAAC